MPLLIDGDCALVGQTELDGSSRGVLTQDSALIEITGRNFILDFTLFGQRYDIDTSPIIIRLTIEIAPLNALLKGAKPTTKLMNNTPMKKCG
ncbi:MAG: hypothetical protein VYA34_10635 [Myxococcota bacterium]|nr:hypothetical protein [Myxococcota bacterium]